MILGRKACQRPRKRAKRPVIHGNEEENWRSAARDGKGESRVGCERPAKYLCAGGRCESGRESDDGWPRVKCDGG